MEELKNDYDKNYLLFSSLCNVLKEQFIEFLNEYNIKIAVPIEARVKTWSSIIEKCDRYQLQLEHISDINDLVGLRIIALFRHDLDRICKIIAENFDVIRKENTEDRLSDNQFGYGSIHLEIKTPNIWSNIITLKKFLGLHIEIQLRTISQHAWAASSHILQYKREEHVPMPLRRSINRVAALLEVVDFELDRLLIEHSDYIDKIENMTNKNNKLNIDILRQLLDNCLPSQNKKGNEPYDTLLDDLMYFGITTIADLENLLLKHMDSIIRADKERVDEERERLNNGEEILGSSEERILAGVFYSYVGLVREALANEFGTEFDDYQKNKAENNYNLSKT